MMRKFGVLTLHRSSALCGVIALAVGLGACSNPVTEGIGNASSSLADRLSLGGSSARQQQAPIPAAVRDQNRPCPRAEIRDGTQTLRVYERGGEGDPGFVRYQGSIMKVARECVYSGDEIISVKFGVSGRVVIGPRGEAGTYSLPIRAAFLPRGGAPVWGELFNVSVTVNPGESSGDFVLVQQTAAYSIQPGERISNFTVFVGFDEQAAN